MSESSTSTDAVEISFSVLWEIKVDDYVDGLDVYSAGEKIGADEVATDSGAKVVEDSVTVCLEHFCVGIETGVTTFSDSFGEELNSVCRVAEYNGLIDL
jgi:hypothetical protein